MACPFNLRTVVFGPDMRLTIVRLPDRRHRLNGAVKEWAFQSELECCLYANAHTKGSFFKLLAKAGADGQSICLRRRAVEDGVVTEGEFVALRNAVNVRARAFTIVPLSAVASALLCYGRSRRSEALASALGLRIFTEQAETAEEEEGQREGGGSGEEANEDDSEDEDADEEGKVSGGRGSTSAGPSTSRGDYESSDEEPADTEEEEEPPDVDDGSKNSKAPLRPSPAKLPVGLESELAALDQWRTSSINMSRKSPAVVSITSKNERDNIVRFLGWLVDQKKLSRPTLNAFGSTQIGKAVEMYVKTLVEQKNRKYSTCASYVASFIAVARFVHSRRSAGGATVSTKPIDDLRSLQTQIVQMARRQATFDVASPSKPFLAWADVQMARRRAEERLAALVNNTDLAQKQEATRDVAMLMFLTHQPPDRVGVCRLLKMGATLKRMEGGGFELDLSMPGDHKTIAAFGPSRTTVPEAIAKALNAHITLSAVPNGGYVFGSPDNPSEPFQSYQWTRLVQAVFKRHSGVAMSPKDLRSSHIVWLKTGDHGDDTLRAAAQAMRHSSKTQDSASYNKGKSDRLVQQAVTAAAAFAARFPARKP